ncbi:MAG: hypothetical protein VX112_02510 [Pseudomonadota bacterium]|nr:hypothetical protein [Pseudomonadota bacterium]
MIKHPRFSYRVILVIFAVTLFGCEHHQTLSDQSIDNINHQVEDMLKSNVALSKEVNILPEEVEGGLYHNKDGSSPNQDKQEVYNLSVQNLPAQKFFRTLALKTNTNMVVDEDIAGSITLDLNQVTLPEIFDILANVYDFYFEKTGRIIHVTTMQLNTKIFTLEGLALKRSGVSTLKVDNSTQGMARSGSSSEVQTKFDIDNLWEEIQVTLESIVQVDHRVDSLDKKRNYLDKPSVNVNQSTGAIVVRSYPKEMMRVEKFIARLKSMYSKQVVIETKLLEVQLKKSHESGLDLQLPHLQFTGDMNGLKYFAESVDYPDSPNLDQPFRAFLNYLSLQGQVTVLSSPRITTMNRQKAVIKIGQDNYYLVGTDTQTSTQNEAVSTSLSLQPFFSGISLDVTPEIQDDNKINLHIHPLISDVVGKDYSFQLGGDSSESYVLNLPESSVRESDSVIQAYSGQFIAIGGLMKRKTETSRKRLPKFFSKSNDLRYRDMSETTELVIVLMPKIVDVVDSGITAEINDFTK